MQSSENTILEYNTAQAIFLKKTTSLWVLTAGRSTISVNVNVLNVTMHFIRIAYLYYFRFYIRLERMAQPEKIDLSKLVWSEKKIYSSKVDFHNCWTATIFSSLTLIF